MSDIHIRRAVAEDAAAVAEIFSSELAVAGTLQIPYATAEQWKERLSPVQEGRISLVAVIDDEIVGNIGFYSIQRPRRKHVGGIGMAVKEQHQGRGVGTALVAAVTDLADNWLDLKRLELTVYTDNKAAIALYEKFDFRIEGEAKAFAFRGGEYVDAYYMARVIQ